MVLHACKSFALSVGNAISLLALAAVFVVAVVPTALLVRLSGKDSLRLRRDEHLASYWLERAPAAQDARSLGRQY